MRICPPGNLPLLMATLLPVLHVSVMAGDFVNFEVPPVHPLDLNPNGSLLAVCHTADNRVLLYSMASGTPVQTAAIPVGLDPVSVRWRTTTELWVTRDKKLALLARW